jgi:4-hydroxy-tetrahydrodipicolinate synthase
VARASEAREWARNSLWGIGNSLYTPLEGPDGDEIDWNAYRALISYCVKDLGHPMLWVTSGVAEFWALTTEERKRLLEVAIEVARELNPDVVVQACTASVSAKECVELTSHAQEVGADIAYIQTPMMEAHGGEGVLRFFQYVADRTDIALGMFNSPSSGYVLTAPESARIVEEIPAVCASKEGVFRPSNSRRLHELAPDVIVWECDTTVYQAGWLRAGIVGPVQLGTTAYLYETPENPIFTRWWEMVTNDKLVEAGDYARESGLDAFSSEIGPLFTCYPGRADYFTHWCGVFKHAASLLGLPIGSFPEARPPQATVPEATRDAVHAAYERYGLMDSAA